VVRFSVKGAYGASSTGKTQIVASTCGNVSIGNTGLKFGLNAFSK
jgi:hypothetical protein